MLYQQLVFAGLLFIVIGFKKVVFCYMFCCTIRIQALSIIIADYCNKFVLKI